MSPGVARFRKGLDEVIIKKFHQELSNAKALAQETHEPVYQESTMGQSELPLHWHFCGHITGSCEDKTWDWAGLRFGTGQVFWAVLSNCSLTTHMDSGVYWKARMLALSYLSRGHFYAFL